MTPDDTVDSLMADIKRIKYSNLPYETLLNLEKEIIEEKNELFDELKKVRKSIYDDLENNSASNIEQKKSKARVLKNRIENTNNRLNYLRDQTETKIMEDKFRDFLGSQKRFEVYEKFLMYVIIAIFGTYYF